MPILVYAAAMLAPVAPPAGSVFAIFRVLLLAVLGGLLAPAAVLASRVTPTPTPALGYRRLAHVLPLAVVGDTITMQGFATGPPCSTYGAYKEKERYHEHKRPLEKGVLLADGF